MAKLNLHDKTINAMVEISQAAQSGDDKRLQKAIKKGCKLANEIAEAHNNADHHFKQIVLGSLHKTLMNRMNEFADFAY